MTFVESVGTPASDWLIGYGGSRRPFSSTSVLLEGIPRSDTVAFAPRAVAPSVAVSLPGMPVIWDMAVSRSDAWEASRSSIVLRSITVTGRVFSWSSRRIFEPVTVKACSTTVSSFLSSAAGVGVDGASWARATGRLAVRQASARALTRNVRFMGLMVSKRSGLVGGVWVG